MTSREARCLLVARRPNGADDADPAMAEAIAALRQHPDSAAWVEAEREVDLEVAAKLRQVMPPPDLKERLLAGRPLAYDSKADSPSPFPTLASQPGALPGSPQISQPGSPHVSHASNKPANKPAATRDRPTRPPSPPPHPNYRLPWGLIGGLMAAAAAVAMTITVVQSRTRAAAIAAEYSAQAFQKFVADYISTTWDKSFDLPTSDYNRVSGWLAAQPGAVNFSPPPALIAAGTLGCTVFDWKERKVTLVCFRTASSEIMVQVLAINRDQLSDSPSAPEFGVVGEWNMGSWSQSGITYVALTKLDLGQLRRLL